MQLVAQQTKTNYFCRKIRTMLGIDSKRESIKGSFAKKIWEELLKIWQNETIDEKAEKSESKYQVEWL